MARDRRLVVDHADANPAATEAPDDPEALIIASEHDSAHLRGVTKG